MQHTNPPHGRKITVPPDLSIVVTIVSGAKHLDDCLAALSTQEGCEQERVEIIVPFDIQDREIHGLKSRYPDVIFHPTPMSVAAPASLSHEHFDELRATGLKLAKAELVALLVDHEMPSPDWCREMLQAHRLPHAAVGGAVENSIDRPVNWATYFFDFGRYQNPVSTGPSPFLTDVNIAYKRKALDSIRHTWQYSFHEPVVHGALLEKGETLWLSPDIIVYQNRFDLNLSGALKERYIWGRYFAGNRIAGKSPVTRIFYSVLSPAVPLIIMAKMFSNILKKKRLAGKFLKALPCTLILTISWSWGEVVGYATGKPSTFKPAGQS